MKKLSFLFVIMALLGLNVACSNRTADDNVMEREEQPFEETGEDIGEGIEEAGEEVEDSVE